MNVARFKKIRIVLGVMALALCVVWYGLFLVIKNKVTEVSVIEAKAEEASQYQDKTRALRSLIKDTEPDVQKLSTRFISSEGSVAFIDTIESLGRETGITVSTESIKVIESKDDKDIFETLELVLTTQGPWSNTYKFLALLETLPYKLSIHNTAFTRHDETVVNLSTTTKPTAKKYTWKSSFILNVLKHK